MSDNRRYHRSTKHIASSEQLVAFLDILGFRELLKKNRLDRIFVLFEEIADTIYQSFRMNFLLGFTPIQPEVTNFSDSIILNIPVDRTEKEHILQLRYRMFFDLCRAIIATGLRLQIPIRGGISIGPMFAGIAESVQPVSVNRYGTPVVPVELIDQFGQDAVRPPDYEHRLIPAFKIPVHMGTALTEAYLLESSVNSIGCFLSERLAKMPFIDDLKRNERVEDHEIDGRTLLAINWCNYFHYDIFQGILAYARTQMSHENAHIADKWKSLVSFATSAAIK